jgi:Flp pilus assembly protein TadG
MDDARLGAGGRERHPVGPPPIDERGELTPFLVVFTVALLALFGVVVDGGEAISAKISAESLAEQAARAGAAQLGQALRLGTIDPAPGPAATAVAVTVADAGPAYRASTRVSGTAVAVTVRERVRTSFLGLLGVPGFTIQATATATPVDGVGGG